MSSSSPQKDNFANYISSVYKTTLVERVGLIRAGIPAGYFYETAQAMGVSLANLSQSLGISLSLAYSIKSRGSPSQKKSLSNQIIGIHLLIGQVQNIVEECGDPEGFDAAEWLGTWAFGPNDSLGGHLPADYFDTVVGQEVVSNLLSAIRYGIYQ
ncbi:MbcA/ParS/Xre antitoxin family protein [Limnobacter sp. CACIAM 66H1]|uniref:MbcA/ParS/Xre antitoxin family protein n=1 Tax=Limnobacter sp. CACIAM 66H1 TaxID=1813033 RepID=UPI0025BE8E4A|nr:MbcA/ParS/Xre antitoxin family protein [Limnobacter sp. CACIAM 66H1]